MAEHDSDREDREPEEQGVPFDEKAAWQAIVAGYGEEPPDPPGARPFRPVTDLALPERDLPASGSDAPGAPGAPGSPGASDDADEPPRTARPLGSSVAFAPGVGPRDHSAPEPSDDDFDEDDEGHFEPPEPPPLPEADTTAKFAWLGVVGGPVLLLLAVVLGWDMTWWLALAGVGGFLGGFVTLVTRMRTDEDEDDDPGRGAVV
ncbi:hypothetical protein KUM39_14615 [Streptomyces sp. J2-1]|uniref:hypothetical protein n=1 Tax=Streptomyces corallincola TaxID=2851888 RepID=UPI001C386BE0|nr:hypothetical protein [Streptomyces corallincola]MBV2355588.1 hypothetical protein [Streptomyces corallincola]